MKVGLLRAVGAGTALYGLGVARWPGLLARSSGLADEQGRTAEATRASLRRAQHAQTGAEAAVRTFGQIRESVLARVAAIGPLATRAAQVAELGGKVCVPPTDIPNTGRFCVVNDPTGATISLITLKGAHS